MKWITNLINKIKLEIRYRKKLKELRKRDPFIYKGNCKQSWVYRPAFMMPRPL